jgi:hypothetical protein
MPVARGLSGHTPLLRAGVDAVQHVGTSVCTYQRSGPGLPLPHRSSRPRLITGQDGFLKVWEVRGTSAARSLDPKYPFDLGSSLGFTAGATLMTAVCPNQYRVDHPQTARPGDDLFPRPVAA